MTIEPPFRESTSDFVRRIASEPRPADDPPSISAEPIHGRLVHGMYIHCRTDTRRAYPEETSLINSDLRMCSARTHH